MRLQVLLLLLAVCLQQSCGRKGPLPNPDKVPPKVTFTSPSAGARNVAVNAAISITSAKPWILRPSTIRPSSLLRTMS